LGAVSSILADERTTVLLLPITIAIALLLLLLSFFVGRWLGQSEAGDQQFLHGTIVEEAGAEIWGKKAEKRRMDL
jgi:hypothetical protein